MADRQPSDVDVQQQDGIKMTRRDVFRPRADGKNEVCVVMVRPDRSDEVVRVRGPALTVRMIMVLQGGSAVDSRHFCSSDHQWSRRRDAM